MASWLRITPTVTASSGDSITSAVFTPKDYLFITLEIDASSDGKWRFGDDGSIETASVYGQRDGANGANPWSANAPRSNIECTYGSTPQLIELWIDNTTGGNKMGIGHVVSSATGVGNAPNRKESIFKYTAETSSQINIVQSYGWGTISYANLTILGADATGSDVPPNLPNGSVFITSDTNVHYMFNSSAGTWNEVA